MIFKFFQEKESEDPFIYTEDQLMARLRFFIGVCLALTLTGIVFVVLYSIIFVTQPLNAMSPIDQKFFELIIPIATFLTGTLSGIMLAGKDDKEAKMKALEAATRATPVSGNPTNSTGTPGGLSASASFGGATMSFNKPAPSFGSGSTPSFGAPPATFVAASGKQGPAQEPHPEI
jgi:hypothetical protein